MPLSQGPYLAFAVLCEKVLREADEVLSFIRVVDRVAVPTPPEPPTMAPLPAIPVVPVIALTLAIGLKSGEYVGSVPVKVRIEPPSGSVGVEWSTTSNMDGGDTGVALVIPVQIPAQDQGLYWFAVEVLGEVLTRVPLRIVRQDDVPFQQG